MTDIKFIPKARNANAISNEPFSNGSMIVTTDTGELYVDYNGARIRVGDVISLDTDAQRLATLAPLSKLYWVVETGKLWRWENDWICINPNDGELLSLSLAGKRFLQVAEFSNTGHVYEVMIKTKIPKINQICMPVIHIYGYSGNIILDFNVFLYWSNNKFTYAKAINKGNLALALKAFTYAENGKEYIGIAFNITLYYLHFVVDFLDMWTGTRNYNEGWTVEANTNSTGSIIPEDNLTDIPLGPLCTDITGNANTANTANTASMATNAEQLAGVDGELYIKSYLGIISHDNYGTHNSFDDATLQGEYAFSGTPDELNGPVLPGFSGTNPYYGKLIVEVSDGRSYNGINNYIWQTWQNTTGFVYRRQRVNDGKWSEWAAVATGGLLYPPSNAGINSLGTPTITEVACVPELLADRLQFFPTTKCLAETSTDGTSWTTKTIASSQWNCLLCCNPAYPAGITWDNGTQLRLTFTYNTYVMLSMLYLYVATGSRLKVVAERYRNTTKDWVELAAIDKVTGQPQHITLWHEAVRFTNTANDSYSSKVRVTLIHEGNATDTPKLDMLRWKGGYPAVNPYIYSWNPSKAVTFPSTITATNFIGQWNGKSVASSFDANSTTTIPTCKQIADYVKSLIGE